MKTWDNWQTLIQAGQFPPIIAIGGEERALVDEAVAEVRKRVVEGAARDFNYDRLVGSETSLSVVLSIANMLPMMSAMRLVEVRDAELVGAEAEEWEAYLRSPSSTTVLLLVFSHIDQRHKFIKALDKWADIYRFSALKEYESVKYIEARARKMGITIGKEAAQVLVVEVGNELLLLQQALDKLQLAVGNRITAEDVALHIASTRLEDAFRLGNAIATGNRREALASLLALEADKESPIRLVGLLAWQLRQIVKARALMDQGLSLSEVGKTLAVFGDRQRQLFAAAQQMSLKYHISRLTKLSALDKELKSSRASSWDWMMRVLLQLCPRK